MWHFRKMSRGEINQDPTQEDFFNTDHLDNFSDALVREAIQNSLDAKIKGAPYPVRVRITFPQNQDLPRQKDAERLFQNLYEHINSVDEVTINSPQSHPRINYLVFEDFGTKGLLGNVKASDDPATGENADFYYFWRNVGRGKKEGEERGRWGLGKTMFPASSQIHTFFGLTVRADDKRKLLMGQSVLSIHVFEGNKFTPYGYFGELDGDDGFVIPIENIDVIDDFISNFSITRVSEPGLSVVMPFIRDEISSQELILSVIHHYFFPILSGELVVEINSEGRLVLINKESIDEVAKEYMKESDSFFLGTVKLAKWYLSLTEQNITRAAEQTPHNSPVWKENMFSGEKLDKFAETLDSQQPLCIRVPVHIIPKGKGPILSYFDLVIERDPNLEKPHDIYIRSGITISGVHSLRESGIRALLIANDIPVVTMLGDSENPAHTEWQDRSRKFIGKYKVGKSTLAFIKEAPRSFIRLLNKRSENIDDTALRHIFPDKAKSKNAPPSPSPGQSHDPTKSLRPRPEIKSRPRIFNLTQVADGFSVSLTEESAKTVPMNIYIRLAYDVRRGNPFKRWAAADFDLESKSNNVNLSGGRIQNQAGNRIEVIAETAEFLLNISGFDPTRDLIVDLRKEVVTDATQI